MDYIVSESKEFYDRYNELDFLKVKYDNLQKAEFGVLYGRRRMGKSELLKKFIRKIKSNKIYVNVIDTSKRDFMNTLSQKIEETFKETVKINEWSNFFEFIAEKAKDEKVLFIIDEFQRLESFAKDFIFALQDYLG